jgi:ribosomal-protein-alanine N-acetyltransferase
MAIRIELASLKDLEVLHSIERECFTSEAYTKEQLAFLLRNPNALCFVAKEDNEAVGFIIGMKENSGRIAVGHIVTIDVTPRHRRAGIGLQLLDKLEQEFLAKCVKTIYLEVRTDNKAARTLYAKKGYTELEPLEDYYAKGRHGLRMKKEFR